MAKIPPPIAATVQMIYAAYEAKHATEAPRPHLGASLIGRECRRHLFYAFRWAYDRHIEGRVLRLFETGHLAESRFVANLRAIGVEVHDRDPEGNQWQCHTLGGHVGGSMDGAGVGIPEAPKTWHVLEFKTHGSKSFAKLIAEGVKESKPEHYAQMIVYCGLQGLERALYMAVNKDTDELHVERIEFDEQAFKNLIDKAHSIVTATEPPPRIPGASPTFYTCKFCDHYDVCQGNAAPAVNCRTCAYATPELDGDKRWSCAKWGKPSLNQAEQMKGCESHRYIPSLLDNFAKWTENDSEDVEYRLEDGSTFVNGNGPEHFRSHEIRDCVDKSLLTSPEMRATKRTFKGAKIVAE